MSFCEKNFNCTIDMELAKYGTCDGYVQLQQDINCHLPCLVDNCTRITTEPNEDDQCMLFRCISNTSPAEPTINSNILTTCLSALGSVVLILILVGLVLLYCKKRSAGISGEGNALLENEAENPVTGEPPILREVPILPRQVEATRSRWQWFRLRTYNQSS